MSGPIDKLPLSLQTIARKLHEERELTPPAMRRIVLDAKVQPEDLMPWADYDHPDADSYGRKLAYKGPNFEIMVMSWRPGDFSGIHDHGGAQWGAVQVFGPAEHATFRVDSGRISTLARWNLAPHEAIGVHHDLVHQMGNPTEDQYFLTLHVYGERENSENVTGEARVFDLENQVIQRVDGGVFFALPPRGIKYSEPGPRPDFPTRLRYMVELVRRLRRMSPDARAYAGKSLDKAIAEFQSLRHHQQLMNCLAVNADEKGHQTNSVYWRVLIWELKEAARLQRELAGEVGAQDRFHRYAEFYDAVIGRPSFEQFMSAYLRFFASAYRINWPDQRILSLGCGTGLVERYLIDQYHVPAAQILGLDISEAMVAEAARRIRARQADMLEIPEPVDEIPWDIAFSGLNVFHYLPHHRFEDAVRKTAAQLRPGGYFLGDFITPDHIRWYPNVLFGDNREVISLRTPQLVENHGAVFQESEIVNISFAGEFMEMTYAGKHKRFLPPMNRVRQYFERHFPGGVDVYDAVTLELIPEWADSCESTRYLVVARR